MFNRWIDEIRTNLNEKNISIVLVGNKTDLIEERKITTEEGEEFASERNIFFLETSAKDNSDQMIEKVFTTISSDIVKRQDGDDEKDFMENGKKTTKLDFRDGGKDGIPLKKKKKGCC